MNIKINKKSIEITGEVQMENGSDINQKQREQFMIDFIEFIEERDMCFFGFTK